MTPHKRVNRWKLNTRLLQTYYAFKSRNTAKQKRNHANKRVII